MAQSFVTKLLRQYRDTGDVAPKSRPGRPRSLNNQQMQMVQELVEAQNDITLKELCLELNQRLGLTVSQPTLSRVRQRLHLTRKKKALYPSQKGTDRVQAERAEYWEQVRDVPVQDLVFIDESGVNLGLIRLFGWALQGRRA